VWLKPGFNMAWGMLFSVPQGWLKGSVACGRPGLERFSKRFAHGQLLFEQCEWKQERFSGAVRGLTSVPNALRHPKRIFVSQAVLSDQKSSV
jgi:hypothetical protein